MSRPATVDLANNNGRPEDHLAVLTVALHGATNGLDAPFNLIVGLTAGRCAIGNGEGATKPRVTANGVPASRNEKK